MKKCKVNFDKIINITSLLIAVISLIIAIIALDISNIALNLSSRDYVPQFTYEFKENGDILVENPYPQLYEIDFIELIVIRKIGIEDKINKGFIQFPYIEESKLIRKFGGEKLGSKITINTTHPGPCAFNICPYNSNIIASLKSMLETDYDLNSTKGYMLPSLQQKETYIAVYYSNKNKERKSVISYRYFIHGGGGYDMFTISEEDLNTILKEANIPKFDNVNSLWDYAKLNYFKEW